MRVRELSILNGSSDPQQLPLGDECLGHLFLEEVASSCPDTDLLTPLGSLDGCLAIVPYAIRISG